MKSKLFLFVSIFVLTACNTKNKSVDNKVSLSVNDSTEFYTISANYPVTELDSLGVIKEFVDYVVNNQKEEWKEGGDAYNAEMELRKEFPERANMKYELNINFEKFKSDKYKTVSYLFNTYKFEGGANGTNTVNTFTFGEKKKKLEITDILNIDNNNDIAISKLLAENALKEKSELDKELLYSGLGLSFLKSDGITLDKEKCNCDGYFFGSNLQNFVIQDSSINFYFSKAQIAPAVFGIVEISLPFEILKPYLKSN